MLTLASVVAVLAIRHGDIGLGDLAAFSLLATVLVHPVLSVMRLRLQDRVVVARTHLMAASRWNPHNTLVLHQLSFPQPPEGTSEFTAAELAAEALQTSTDSGCIAMPCCDDLAGLYASCHGVTWVAAHGGVERSALVFAAAERQRDADDGPSAGRAVVALAEFQEKLGRARSFEPA